MPWAEVEVGIPISTEATALPVDELNRMFYERYPRGYFKAALQLAAAAYHDPRGALSPFSEQATLKREEGEVLSRFRLRSSLTMSKRSGRPHACRSQTSTTTHSKHSFDSSSRRSWGGVSVDAARQRRRSTLCPEAQTTGQDVK
jgi:hypothetical protein